MAQRADLPERRTLPLAILARPQTLPFHTQYAASQVAHLLGVTEADLIIWEDQHGLLHSRHDARQRRWYAAHDIVWIRELRRFIYEKHIPPEYLTSFIAHMPLTTKAPRQRKAAPAQRYLTGIAAIVEQLSLPLEHITTTPERVLRVIGATLPKIRRMFEARSAHCWVRQDDGTWETLGEANGASHAEPELNSLAERAFKRRQCAERVDATLGALSVIPLRLGDCMQGVLVLRRKVQARLSAPEKRTAKILAGHLALAVAAARFCRDEERKSAFWEAVMDAVPDAVVIRDPNQQVVYYNQAAFDLTANREAIRAAHAAGIAPPRPTWETTLPGGKPLPDEDVPSVAAVVTGQRITGRELEMYVTAANGAKRVIPMLATAAPVRNKKQEVINSVSFVQDISNLKEIQQRKDAFVSRVLHDNNSPLTSHLLAIQAIQRTAELRLAQLEDNAMIDMTETLQSIHEKARQARGTGERIRGMIDDLRQIEDAAFEPSVRMSLSQTVEARVREMRLLRQTHFINIEGDAADTLLEGDWCKREIVSIIDNLLDNAMKYSPAHTTIRVRLYLERLGNRYFAHLCVADSGRGLAEEDKERIFAKGERVIALDENGHLVGGLGLGLFHCRTLAHQNHGFLFARSDGLGKGSEFHLRLPLAE